MGESVCYSAGKAVGVVGSRCETISFPRHFPVFKLGFYFSGGELARPNSSGRKVETRGSGNLGLLQGGLGAPKTRL